MKYFQTSCNLTNLTPHASKSVIQYARKKDLIINGCCLKFNTFEPEDEIFYVCQNCRKELEKVSEATLTSFYLFLNQDKDFSWPDYQGKTFYIQDCFRDMAHIEIQQAVRSILRKMNIHYIESGVQDMCGTMYYHGVRTEKWSEEKKREAMIPYVQQFGDIPVITYCNRCRKDILLGGHEAYHILQFVFPEN